MEAITTAQDVAAIWFIVFFGGVLLAPLWASIMDWLCRLHRRNTCVECENFFDDNPGKSICRSCEDWLVLS